MNSPQKQFWVCDFEFTISEGNRPKPICMVAHEINTGKTESIWLQGVANPQPPFNPLDENVTYISFYSIAELTCHLALNWSLPINIIDLYPEYKIVTNGYIGEKNGLIDACARYGVPTIDQVTKDTIRVRIIQGPPYTDEEKNIILEYCKTDVIETTGLYKAMLPTLDIDRALFRGQYMKCNAIMEHNGIPIDKEILDRLIANWESIKIQLIKEVDQDFGVYDGTTFKIQAFEEYLGKNKMSWPVTPSGHPALDDETFRDMVGTYPQLAPLRDLRNILGKMKIKDLPVGEDSRNRSMLSPFSTKTGRNAPRIKFIFINPTWIRSLIKPNEGKALAYIDYGQEEFYIAAIFSEDKNMQAAYESGDPYLYFAKLAGAVPPDATKKSHKTIRDLYKTCCLGVQYGMKSESLGIRINRPEAYAKELIHNHKRVFPNYWKWQDETLRQARFKSDITTAYGWTLHLQNYDRKEDNTIKNFLMQATGAEILRVACYLLNEAGIKILAPVHDALLCEFDLETCEAEIKKAELIMQEASKIVLGKPLKTDVEIIKYPDRYADEKGKDTWNRVNNILEGLESGKIKIEYSDLGTKAIKHIDKVTKISRNNQTAWFKGVDKDLIDFEALKDSTLSGTENQKNLKGMWKEYL